MQSKNNESRSEPEIRATEESFEILGTEEAVTIKPESTPITAVTASKDNSEPEISPSTIAETQGSKPDKPIEESEAKRNFANETTESKLISDQDEEGKVTGSVKSIKKPEENKENDEI